MAADWYFDDHLWRDFHDCMFSPEHFADAAGQAEALVDQFGDGLKVVDLACGPGRHSLPLARLGCKVTAVDASAFLLERLNSALQAHAQHHDEALPVEVVQTDMRGFETNDVFDLAICLWTSFGYFEDPADDLLVARRAFDALKPGGHFIIDVVGKEYICRHLEPVMTRELDDGSLLIEQPELTDHCSVMHNRWTLVRDDTVARAEFSHRVYSAVELEALCRQAGFSDVEIYGGLDWSVYDLESERLVVVAQKAQ